MMSVYERVNEYVFRLPARTTFSLARNMYPLVADMVGADLTEQVRSALERRRDEYRDVVFAMTLQGRCPLLIWNALGGDPIKRERGHYLKVTANHPMCHWWNTTLGALADDMERHVNETVA